MAKSQEERYKKMVFQEKRGEKWGMYPGHSADGIHWKSYSVNRSIAPFYSDTNNNLIWNARNQEYMLYLRTYPRLDRWMKPERLFPSDYRVRTPAWASSQDFLEWDGPSDKEDPEERYVCFHADAQDRPGDRDFYTLEVLPYAGGFVGFTSTYHNLFGQIPAGADSGKARALPGSIVWTSSCSGAGMPAASIGWATGGYFCPTVLKEAGTSTSAIRCRLP